MSELKTTADAVKRLQNSAFNDGIKFALAVLTHPANDDFDQTTKNLIVAELQKHINLKLWDTK